MPVVWNQDAVDLPNFTTTSDTYAHDLYRDVLKEGGVEAFLKETVDYDSSEGKWSIPDAKAIRSNLIGSLCSILSSVLDRFVKSSEPGVERVLVNTTTIPECDKEDDKGYRALPVLVVHAAGPSFQVPTPERPIGSQVKEPTELGFSGIATFFSVKLGSELGSAEQQVDEMGTYARRILRAQPNRLHVRCLVLTEKHARLLHFDRSGAEISPLVDFHQFPTTFVRLVTGLSSVDEGLLGMDTSIQWNIVNGRKGQGTLTTTGPDGRSKTYPILGRIPTSRTTICGRATTCWRVQDPDTLVELVIKDSWRPEYRPGEYELLESVKGIPAVAQMVAYETGRGETKAFRCPTTAGRYLNRFATRVTLKSYGPPLECFTSPLQVLSALRDAIAGHRKLTNDDTRILHRDISAHNVLYGKPDAPEGERGVLIDLDLAFKATDAKPGTKVDYNIGIRIFQSLSVLGSLYNEEEAPDHDYLDDLESFFYLLSYIFLLYRPDGSRIPSEEEGPSVLWTWSDDDASVACSNKELIFGTGDDNFVTARAVHSTWGSTCGHLFDSFRDWMAEIRSDKDYIAFNDRDLRGLLSQREEHYSVVLKMFDDAVEAIEPPLAVGLSTSSDSKRSATFPFPPSPHNSKVGDMLICAVGKPTATMDSAPPGLLTRPPTSLSPSVPPVSKVSPFQTQPRRSARIRNLLAAKEERPVPSPNIVPPPAKISRPLDPPPPTELRRSSRILKRRLEDAERSDLPQPKAKRTRKDPRRTTCPR